MAARGIKGLVVAAGVATVVTTGVTSCVHQAGSVSAPRTTGAACTSAGLAAHVVKVTDGDTIHTRFLCGPESGATTTDRIIGINTPETKRPGTPIQCYGPEASAYAARQLADRDVVLVSDRKAGLRDKYGRRLFFVEVGGHDYGEGAIKAGLAEHNDYGHRESRSAAYAVAQVEAQLAHVGAWSACPSPFKK